MLLTDWDEYKVESKGREEDGSQNADDEEYMDPEDPNFVVCGYKKSYAVLRWTVMYCAVKSAYLAVPDILYCYCECYCSWNPSQLTHL